MMRLIMLVPLPRAISRPLISCGARGADVRGGTSVHDVRTLQAHPTARAAPYRVRSALHAIRAAGMHTRHGACKHAGIRPRGRQFANARSRRRAAARRLRRRRAPGATPARARELTRLTFHISMFLSVSSCLSPILAASPRPRGPLQGRALARLATGCPYPETLLPSAAALVAGR
jgi:hypothetical protein